MTEPIYVNDEHKIIIETFVTMCQEFAKEVSTKKRYEIYLEISKLTNKFRTMAYGLTSDENEVNESVQELMLYFLNMNPKTLSDIWNKDKEEGIIRYGAVALRRALTSPRSNYYYN